MTEEHAIMKGIFDNRHNYALCVVGVRGGGCAGRGIAGVEAANTHGVTTVTRRPQDSRVDIGDESSRNMTEFDRQM